MRLLNGDGVAGLGLPVLVERLVVLFVELAGRIVGDIEQGALGSKAPAARARVVAAASRLRRSAELNVMETSGKGTCLG